MLRVFIYEASQNRIVLSRLADIILRINVSMLFILLLNMMCMLTLVSLET